MGIETLAALFVFLGLVLIAIAVPLLQRKIGRNPLYGLRIPLTMRDDRIWYEANAYLGRWLVGNGVVAILIALVGLLIPGLSLDGYAMLCLIVTVSVSIVGIWMSLRYAYSLRQ